MKELITDAQFKELLAELDRTTYTAPTPSRRQTNREALEKNKKDWERFAELMRTEGRQVPEHVRQTLLNLAAELEEMDDQQAT